MSRYNFCPDQEDPLLRRESDGLVGYDKRRQPWIAWLCAAPMPPIGVALGLFLTKRYFDRQIEARLVESPEEFVCGSSTLLVFCLGLFGGCLGGIVAGNAIADLVTARMRRRGSRDTTKSVTPEL